MSEKACTPFLKGYSFLKLCCKYEGKGTSPQLTTTSYKKTAKIKKVEGSIIGRGSLLWQKKQPSSFANHAGMNHQNGWDAVQDAANGTKWLKK